MSYTEESLSMTSWDGSLQDGQVSLVRRNCDYCVKKKVKCSGESPCHMCKKKHLQCIYSVKKKPGPKSRKRDASGVEVECSDHDGHQENDFPKKRARVLLHDKGTRAASRALEHRHKQLTERRDTDKPTSITMRPHERPTLIKVEDGYTPALPPLVTPSRFRKIQLPHREVQTPCSPLNVGPRAMTPALDVWDHDVGYTSCESSFSDADESSSSSFSPHESMLQWSRVHRLAPRTTFPPPLQLPAAAFATTSVLRRRNILQPRARTPHTPPPTPGVSLTPPPRLQSHISLSPPHPHLVTPTSLGLTQQPESFGLAFELDPSEYLSDIGGQMSDSPVYVCAENVLEQQGGYHGAYYGSAFGPDLEFQATLNNTLHGYA